jgi:protein gp37
MASTKIEWTESTWNPITGCTKITAGCKFCYAEIMTRRLKAMGQEKYKNGFEITLHPETLSEPYKDIPVEYIKKVFKVMNENPHHVFQVLTKRADVLAYYDSEGWLTWSHNIWMGVTVEDNKVVNRIDLLRKTGAKVKFLSCEPLITDLPCLNLKNIDWVIVGGESGRTPRSIDEEWVLNIKEQCNTQSVAFYFKQWGGTNKKKNGRLLQGKVYSAMPV